MSEPLIVITKLRIEAGKLEEVQQYYRQVLNTVEANEPRIIAMHAYVNESGTEMTSVQLHPDTASMDAHMQVLKDNWDESFSQYAQMMGVMSIEYYGTAPESALEMDRQGQWGLSVTPRHIAGFTRSSER
jgi:hypothetical protein